MDYDFEEINSAGNCFYIRWQHDDQSENDDEYLIDIFTDEECEDAIESYIIDIQVKDEWDDEMKSCWINQEIVNSVRETIEYL